MEVNIKTTFKLGEKVSMLKLESTGNKKYIMKNKHKLRNLENPSVHQK